MFERALTKLFGRSSLLSATSTHARRSVGNKLHGGSVRVGQSLSSRAVGSQAVAEQVPKESNPLNPGVDERGNFWAHEMCSRAATKENDKPQVTELYDEFGGSGEYDSVVINEWGYIGHEKLTDWMVEYLPKDEALEEKKILDCGCGAGLLGPELYKKGFRKIIGCDASMKSLEIVQTRKSDVYTATVCLDLDVVPHVFEDDTFDGVVCSAVLTYPMCRYTVFKEWCRYVKSGGIVAFTHRVDKMQIDGKFVYELEDDGLWEVLIHEKDQPYYPKLDFYQDKNMHIDYVVARVL